MEETIKRSDLFITISRQMKEVYTELFNKESIVAVNMTESLKDDSMTSENNELITLVYTGGLHFKRYLTLSLLARALKKYNENPLNIQKAMLKIYSGQELSKGVIKWLNILGASEYCGSLNPIQLKEILNSCEIPVHVESFDHKSIESTRLSISTKIPEYLSLGKPIIAIGPIHVASMEYLKDSVLCITQVDNIYFNLKEILNNNNLREILSKKALIKFEENHVKEREVNRFMLSIIDLKNQ